MCHPQVFQQAARQVIGSLSRPSGNCGYGIVQTRSNHGQSLSRPYQQASRLRLFRHLAEMTPEELGVLAGIDVDEYFVGSIVDHEERGT